jgi:opacity protein-like surface antigen
MGNAFRFDLHAKSVLGRGPHQGRHGNVPIRYHRLWLLAGLVLLTVIYTARPATAEMYVGLYGTYGIQIGKPNPTIRAGAEIEDVVGLGLEVTLNDVDIDNFLTGGFRLGYWFNRLLPWYGLGVDFQLMRLQWSEQVVDAESNASATIDIGDEPFTINLGTTVDLLLPHVDILTANVAFDIATFRWGFYKSEQFPQGRLQPYFMGGPALMFVLRNTNTKAEISTTLGLKAAVGVSWTFSKLVGAFVEYKFTHFNPNINTGTVMANGVRSDAEVSVPINTHYINFGINFNFLY